VISRAKIALRWTILRKRSVLNFNNRAPRLLQERCFLGRTKGRYVFALLVVPDNIREYSRGASSKQLGPINKRSPLYRGDVSARPRDFRTNATSLGPPSVASSSSSPSSPVHVSDGEQVVWRGNGFNNYFYNVSKYTRASVRRASPTRSWLPYNPAAHGTRAAPPCKPTRPDDVFPPNRVPFSNQDQRFGSERATASR